MAPLRLPSAWPIMAPAEPVLPKAAALNSRCVRPGRTELRPTTLPLRYPLDGALQDIVVRAMRERRGISLLCSEEDRAAPLQILRPSTGLSGGAQLSGGVAASQGELTALTDDEQFCLHIEGARDGICLTPGVVVGEGVHLVLRNLSIRGSGKCVYQDGTLMSPMVVHERADVEADRVVFRAQDERGCHSYCCNISAGARLQLENCEAVACHQEFAICAGRGARLNLQRCRIAGVCLDVGGMLRAVRCDIQGVESLSAAGIFARSPIALELKDNEIAGFRYEGIHVQASGRPGVSIISGNVIRSVGECSMRLSRNLFASEGDVLKWNDVGNGGRLGSLCVLPAGNQDFVRETDAVEKERRQHERRAALHGFYCGGCLELRAEIDDVIRIFGPKGSELAVATASSDEGEAPTLLLYGDIASWQSCPRGLLWSNGDFWEAAALGSCDVQTLPRALSGPEPNIKQEEAPARKNPESKLAEFTKLANADQEHPGQPEENLIPSSRSSPLKMRLRMRAAEEMLRRRREAGQSRDAERLHANGLVVESEKDMGEGVIRCVVCLDTAENGRRHKSWAFQACGHSCLCKSCARRLRELRNKSKVKCPICRISSRIVPAELCAADRLFNL